MYCSVQPSAVGNLGPRKDYLRFNRHHRLIRGESVTIQFIRPYLIDQNEKADHPQNCMSGRYLDNKWVVEILGFLTKYWGRPPTCAGKEAWYSFVLEIVRADFDQKEKNDLNRSE
jgi:hypothetical protein